MDQKQIEDIVHAVMHKLKAAGGEDTRKIPGQVTTASEVRHQPAVVPDEGALPDLGSDEIKTLVGVRQPHRKEVLEDLRHSTGTRIAGGRCGPRPVPLPCCASWPTTRAPRIPCSRKSPRSG